MSKIDVKEQIAQQLKILFKLKIKEARGIVGLSLYSDPFGKACGNKLRELIHNMRRA